MAASRYTPWATAKASTAAPTGARRAASATATPSTAVPDGQTRAQHLSGAAAIEAGQPGVAEVGQGLGRASRRSTIDTSTTVSAAPPLSSGVATAYDAAGRP